MSIRKRTAQEIRDTKTARKASQLKGRGINAPRPKLTDNTKLQPFVVAQHKPAIFDCLGNKCISGDTAMLDETLAKFYAKRGQLDVEIVFDNRAKPLKELAHGDGEAGDSPEPYSAETVATAAADPDGGKSGGGDDAPDGDEAEVESVPRGRRKRSL